MLEGYKTKILVVDDDPLVRDMLGMVLEAGGYEVEKAKDGGVAIEKHNAAPVDAIVSDMNMPEVDGLELIKRLRDSGDDVPVIILTGNNEISVAINALNSGANDYLLKDENIQDTVNISVEKVLEKYQLRRQNQQLLEDLARKNERLENDRILAQKVQKNILPKLLQFPGFEIATFYQPSDKIGGDFFDAWELNGKVHFAIGDVSGHSTSSALIMAVCKGMLRSLGQSCDDPIELIKTTNRMLCDILSDSGMFISMVYGSIRKDGGKLDILSAGHNPVFLYGCPGVQTVDSMGPVMGWDPEDEWETQSYSFDEGAGLFLYTDGLTEAKNGSGEEFGEARLKDLVEQASAPNELIDNVFKCVGDFCSESFADDLTMFTIQKGKK